MKAEQLQVVILVLVFSLLTLLTVAASQYVQPTTNSSLNPEENVAVVGQNRVLQASTASSSSSATSTTTSSTTSSSSSTMSYGENFLVLSLDSATYAERKLGDRFIVGLQPQLISATPVISLDAYIGFNPTQVRVVRIVELATYSNASKNIDNINGLVKFNAQAANGARFTNGQILFQLEFEVIATQSVFTSINVLANSSLGNPNTVARDGYSKLDVTLNNPPIPSSSSVSFSSVSSRSSVSATSSVNTSLDGEFTSGENPINPQNPSANDEVNLRTVLTSILGAIAVSSAIAAIAVWNRQRSPKI